MGGKVHGGAGGKAHEMDPQSLLDRILSDEERRRWLLSDAGRPGQIFDPQAPPPPKENNDPFDPLNQNDPTPPVRRTNPADDPTGGNNGDPPTRVGTLDPPTGGNNGDPNRGGTLDPPTGGNNPPLVAGNDPTIGGNSDPNAGGRTRVAGNDVYTGGNTGNGNTINPPPADRYTGGNPNPPPPTDRYTGGTATAGLAGNPPRDTMTGGGTRVAGVRSSGLTSVAMNNPAARALDNAPRTSGLIPRDQMLTGSQTANYLALRHGNLAAAFQPTGIG